GRRRRRAGLRRRRPGRRRRDRQRELGAADRDRRPPGRRRGGGGAGPGAGVERAGARAGERGGRKSVLLPVSAPFHCALMAPAAEGLATALARVPVSDPTIPVVRNVDGDGARHAPDVVPFLLRQVASPVRWTDCVRRLAAEGATAFVEV